MRHPGPIPNELLTSTYEPCAASIPLLPKRRKQRLLVLALATLTVSIWRGAALAVPSTIVQVPPEIRIPMSVLGLIFLGAGLVAASRKRDEQATWFWLYCLGGAVHWGGSIGGTWEPMFLVIYVAASYAAEASLLILALRFAALGPGRGLAWLYLPAISSLLLAPFAGLADRTLSTAGAALLLGLATLLSLCGWLVFVRKAFSSRLEPPERHAARVIAASLAGCSLVAALGSGGLLPRPDGVPADAYNLALAGIPITLAAVLTALGGGKSVPGTVH